jgi:ABC-type transport system involved in multi-copper enzyme maturation permease subunit
MNHTSLDKILAIAIKNLKIKFATYQTYLYTIGFPLMFTLLFYFIFGTQATGIDDYKVFDFSISGMIIYAASFGTISAALSLTKEKQQGTLLRLDTTPVGRDKIFLGTLLSEATFLVIQLLIMFILGYAVLGLKWHYNDPILLIFGFLIAFFFGLSTLGLGIIISAFAKTADSALGISMVYAMMSVFISGALIPFQSPVVYCFPPFYANMLYKQIVIFGDNFWTSTLRFADMQMTPDPNGMPLWCAFLILLIFLLVTLIIGIKLFQRKTLT